MKICRRCEIIGSETRRLGDSGDAIKIRACWSVEFKFWREVGELGSAVKSKLERLFVEIGWLGNPSVSLRNISALSRRSDSGVSGDPIKIRLCWSVKLEFCPLYNFVGLGDPIENFWRRETGDFWPLNNFVGLGDPIKIRADWRVEFEFWPSFKFCEFDVPIESFWRRESGALCNLRGLGDPIENFWRRETGDFWTLCDLRGLEDPIETFWRRETGELGESWTSIIKYFCVFGGVLNSPIVMRFRFLAGFFEIPFILTRFANYSLSLKSQDRTQGTLISKFWTPVSVSREISTFFPLTSMHRGKFLEASSAKQQAFVVLRSYRHQ